MPLATFVDIGRACVAKAIASQPLHLAWGSGDPIWDNPDYTLPPLHKATAMTRELGRRVPTVVDFVEPDEEGSIVVPVAVSPDGSVEEARYRLVTGKPTPYLYLLAHFNYGDAANAIIRELAVFMDTVTKPDLPPGQRYFTPAELEDPGRLMAIQILRPHMTRSPSIRQSVEFVFPI